MASGISRLIHRLAVAGCVCLLSATVMADAAITAVQASRALPEALVPFGEPSVSESEQLHAALKAYAAGGDSAAVEPLTVFLSEHPQSPWRQSLWLGLGDVYFQQGYFSDALNAWQAAWDSGKSATAPEQRAIADQAMGELVRMHARLGHSDDVAALLREVSDRPLTGASTEAVQGAREGLWEMRNEPGVAYLCGPMALRSLLMFEGGHADGVSLLEAARSGPHGISLGEVARFARQAGMPYVPKHRVSGSDIPVPSVVHWSVNHYAAILKADHGRYLVQDPTFGRETWLTAQAINAQTSGFFMVQAGMVGPGRHADLQ